MHLVGFIIRIIEYISTVHTTNLYDIYHCCVYGDKLIMMDRGTVRNMYSFITKINLRN